MLKDLFYLVSFYSNDRDRLILKLYCRTIYFKFINDFKLCCINNYIISIKILSLANDNLDWNWGLFCACEGGHRDLVNLMIEHGAYDWNGGLVSACKGGADCGHCPHRDFVDFMIQKGANDWNWGLTGACMGGHCAPVDFMIKGRAIRVDKGFFAACLC